MKLRTGLLLPLAMLLALRLRGDTIQLKTGERIEGAFKQATSAGAVIELGGQSITIPLENLQAIYFGAAGRAVVGPVPCVPGQFAEPERLHTRADSPQVPAASAPPPGIAPMTNPKPAEKTTNGIVVNPSSPALTDEVYRVGGGVTPPTVIYKIDPEYSEEARKAKHSGTVVLYIEVDTSGHATHVKVVRGIGLGLDEKAIEAVHKWTFKPGQKDGKPVVVAAHIEVTFRLLRPTSHHVEYRVAGTASGVSLMYTNETGGTAQLNVKLPWSLLFDASSGRVLYLAAQKQGRGGTIRSEILVDSVSYHHAESNASYGIASVHGPVP